MSELASVTRADPEFPSSVRVRPPGAPLRVVPVSRSLPPVFAEPVARTGRYELPKTALVPARLAWILVSIVGYLWVRVSRTGVSIRPDGRPA